MRIVADRNTPYLAEALSGLGEVVLLPSSAIDAAAVREADVLLVRSTVKVGPALLAGSRVRLVATATIGVDHLDLPWLEAQGIAWASAPGSNAPSVAEWFTAAVLTLARRQGRPLAGRVAGVVGVGQVGSRVARVLEALGCQVLRCDPPRARAEGAAGFSTLDEVLERADLLTLHVPRIDAGEDRTVGLVDAARIGRMRPGAWLISSCRGDVSDGPALAAARREGRLGGLILDVFPGEPAVAPGLVEAADLATPHIAGHSLDGKAAGTLAVYQAVCRHLGRRPMWSPGRSLPARSPAALALDGRDLDDEALALQALRRYYDIEVDDAALRKLVRLPATDRGAAFRAYRDQYPVRREVRDLMITLRPRRPRAAAVLESLGARVEG